MTKYHEVADLGQAIWLDYIRRSFITSGDLRALVDDGLRGVTSNPTIFEKAIAGSTDYDDALQGLVNEGADSKHPKTVEEIYEALTLDDIQRAAGQRGASQRLGFRATFLNNPNIGGRYSALSYFGLVPAALVGVDVPTLLGCAMAATCGGYSPSAPTLRLDADGTPFKTDQGNLILDCNFGPIPDPSQLAGRLNERAGIVEHGLFIGLATDVIVAGAEGVRHLKRET